MTDIEYPGPGGWADDEPQMWEVVQLRGDSQQDYLIVWKFADNGRLVLMPIGRCEPIVLGAGEPRLAFVRDVRVVRDSLPALARILDEVLSIGRITAITGLKLDGEETSLRVNREPSQAVTSVKRYPLLRAFLMLVALKEETDDKTTTGAESTGVAESLAAVGGGAAEESAAAGTGPSPADQPPVLGSGGVAERADG